MIFRPGTKWEVDLLPSIAPIFRIDLSTKKMHLIGTGFWITDNGHLVTARHVIQDNMNSAGSDLGPIFALQTFPDRSFNVRSLSRSDLHPHFDLALSETVCAPQSKDLPTTPLTLSLEELEVLDPVCSFAVLSHDHLSSDEDSATIYKFQGSMISNFTLKAEPLNFAVQFSIGEVKTIFEEKRDSVMLNFPCIETNVPIYGGNSGGPLLDQRGRICGVHCTSFDGDRISYHVPIYGIFSLNMAAQSLDAKAPSGKLISVLDLALNQDIYCEPPLLDTNRIIYSGLRWLWYAAKCFTRREMPSKDYYFGSSKVKRMVD